MELKEIIKEFFEKAIRDMVTVKMINDYLAECDERGASPDLKWLRYLLKGSVTK